MFLRIQVLFARFSGLVFCCQVQTCGGELLKVAKRFYTDYSLIHMCSEKQTAQIHRDGSQEYEAVALGLLILSFFAVSNDQESGHHTACCLLHAGRRD